MAGWRRLVKQTSAMFAARLVGAALVFATQAMMARHWGANVLGDYLLIVAAVNLVAIIMPLGFQVVGGYFAAEYGARGDGASLRAFVRRAYFHIALTAAILVAAGAAAQHWGLLHGIAQTVWLPALLMALATAIVFLSGALLVGLRRPVAGLLADTLFRPMAVLLGFFAVASLGGSGDGLAAMIWIAALIYIVIAAGQAVLAVICVNTIAESAAPDTDERRRWWRFALPWIAITALTEFFFDIDLVLLSGLLSRDELAVFGVCARIVSLCAFGVASIYAVTMPDIFEAGARRDRIELHRRIGDANLIAATFALAMAVSMFAAGPLLSLAFGPAFATGAVPLGILCFGLAVRAVLGPASLVLSFYDRPYAGLGAAAVALAVLVLGNAMLVPAFGLNGAALSAPGFILGLVGDAVAYRPARCRHRRFADAAAQGASGPPRVLIPVRSGRARRQAGCATGAAG